MIFALGEGMGWWPMARSALSPVEVDEVWRRWRSGQAVKVLAREMRRNPSTVPDLLKLPGGIRPVPRRRWELRLWLAEREEISRGLAVNRPVSESALQTALQCVLRLHGRRGHPAVEIQRDNGSSLSVATDGSRAVLMWVNSVGTPSTASEATTPAPSLCSTTTARAARFIRAIWWRSLTQHSQQNSSSIRAFRTPQR